MNNRWLFLLFALIVFLFGCSEKTKELSVTPTPTPSLTPTLTPSLTSTPTAKPKLTPTSERAFTFYFYVDELEEPLKGIVYLNDEFLGTCTNGLLKVPTDKLSPGKIVLKGNYDGEPFEFEWDLYKSDIEEYSELDCYVPYEDFIKTVFNGSKLNTTDLEQRILFLINEERTSRGLKPYKWNDWVRNIAYNHSKDMAERGYFNHKSPEGENHYNRLKKSGMFFIVGGENLMYFSGLSSKFIEYTRFKKDRQNATDWLITNIAKETVEGWLESPGHRSIVLDRDNLYSDIGIGVYCKKDECYITMNVVGLEEHDEITLDKRYAVYYYLNNPTYGFNFSVPVSIKIEASKPVNVYIFPSKEEYENFMDALQYKSLETAHRVTSYEKTITAEVGYVLAVYSPLYDSARVNISIRYYPE